MTIPFRVKKLTETAKEPTRENPGDLWDLYADSFCIQKLQNVNFDGTYTRYNAFEINDIEANSVLKDGEHLQCRELCVNSIINDDCNNCFLYPQGIILVKTGISLELPRYYSYPKSIDFPDEKTNRDKSEFCWVYDDDLMLNRYKEFHKLIQYAVADIHQCSDALEQRGLFIENKIITGGEVSFVAINNGHEPITISKGDVIAKMLIRPLYPSKMEIVKDIEDTGRGGYGSTGK